MKDNKLKKILIIIVIVLVVGAVGFKFYYTRLVNHPFKLTVDSVELEVKEGQSLNDVLKKLSKQNIIGNTYLIKYYVKSNDLDTNIKKGRYLIEKNMTLDTFLSNLSLGKVTAGLNKVTIPEGYNIEEIAASLEKSQVISKEEFLKAVKEYNAPSYIKKNSERKYQLEGFLFPDTYEFEKDISGEEIIERMLLRFEEVISEIEQATGKKIDKNNLDDIVTMASIVEKEAERDDERGKVASVFYNRIEQHTKFQSCATVLYALGYHKAEVSNEDIKVNSPYNTYKVDGLPIGPIACPGKASLNAAINPEKTNYLFFISNDDGTHTFTDNDKEFMRLKEIRDNKNKK